MPLAEIEAYYDAVPRSLARTETLGPFTLFINTGPGWAYYARPTLGATQFTPAEVQAVRQRQRQLNLPEAMEWVAEVTPSLAEPVKATGLDVSRHPLMLLQQTPPTGQRPPGVEIRLATPADDILSFNAVAHTAFTGSAQATEPDPEELPLRQARLGKRLSVMAVAFVDGSPVGVGSHNPVDSVTEIVGVGVLPGFRRRGIAAALTQTLVHEALQHGARTIFLSAGDADVARIYARVGFATIATACTAEPRPN